MLEARVLRVLMTYIILRMWCVQFSVERKRDDGRPSRNTILGGGRVSPSVKHYKLYTFPGNPLIIPRVLSFTCVRGCDVIIVLRARLPAAVLLYNNNAPAAGNGSDIIMEYYISKEKFYCRWGGSERPTSDNDGNLVL